uniref:DNA/RNA non-specific endonuclease n=2 Tax=Laodelphax striatellus TaxID=195883 RepID=A0A219LVU9_LAOST|nr:DNA/RNA non-specific endonuclease [Laodelphax striatellus]
MYLVFKCSLSSAGLIHLVLLVSSFSICTCNPVDSSANYHLVRAGCMLLTNQDWGEPQSLILNSNMTKIVYPETEDSVLLYPCEDIVLACPGSKFKLTEDEVLHAKCERGTQISADHGGSPFDFQTASCEKLPRTTAMATGRCGNDGEMKNIEIGFVVKENFISLIDICFDENLLTANFSLYQASYRIAGRQHGFPRMNFIAGKFYGDVEIWKLYSRQKQRETLARILGSEDLASTYIKDDKSYYLARGHLTAKADFVYGAEQMATFYYINVAPQWQIINAGNWAALEDNVRTYIIKNKLEVLIYTIPHGVAVLPDVDGTYQPLYLYFDENNNGLIPVPKLYIKAVVDPVSKTGIAFLTVNNPYVTMEEIQEQNYVICEDICDELDWLTWDPTNIKKGYSYCCNIKDLAKSLDFMPEIDVDDILR